LAGVNGIALAVGAWSFCKRKATNEEEETLVKDAPRSLKEEIKDEEK
jgi:hypothetical protein